MLSELEGVQIHVLITKALCFLTANGEGGVEPKQTTTAPTSWERLREWLALICAKRQVCVCAGTTDNLFLFNK